MTLREKRLLARISAAGLLFLLLLPFHFHEGLFKLTGLALFREPLPFAVMLPAALAAYLIAGGNVLWRAAKNIANGQVFDENFLMAVATIGAFLLGEYAEGVAVMLFYQVGELFQSVAVSRSRRSIADLMDIRPDYAHVLRDGGTSTVDPEEVAVGEEILIRPGEKIPLDGEIVEGFSSLSTGALTGEAAPKDVAPGDAVVSGCVNITGLLRVRVAKAFGESTVAKVLALVETASDRKSRSESFITKFARIYTPAVVAAAVLLAVIPPLFGQPFALWAVRALTFLVISCPCALVISVPLSFFGGLGGASKAGILIKGGNYLEQLAHAKIAVFDKTGTLTKGSFTVVQHNPENFDGSELLRLAASAEHFSPHPIAQSIRDAWGKEVDPSTISEVEELPGLGVFAMVDGQTVLVGNSRLMAENNISFTPAETLGTAVYVAVNGVFAGSLRIADTYKPDAKKTVAALRGAGIAQTALLTGDTWPVAKQAAGDLGLDMVYAELLPEEKVFLVEMLMASLQGRETLLFVGDGVNDAPVLARADVGIAMGGLGSDAAIEAADVVIMTDEPSKAAKAVAIGRKTLRIARQNIVFALGVKAVVLLLGALGTADMWAAVFADVGVSVLAVANALRAMRV